MIGIVNYGAGNLFSLKAALDRLDIDYGMVNTADQLADFDRIIIPGVGHAGVAMRKLQQSGLAAPISRLAKPVLGICVGMQLLTNHSTEGDSKLLDIVPIRTLHFEGRISGKVPHMGWNTVSFDEHNALFKGIGSGSYFYFVHSYFIEYNPTFTVASADYGLRFSAALQHENFFGVQFHPEKSGTVGEQLLRNFSMMGHSTTT